MKKQLAKIILSILFLTSIILNIYQYIQINNYKTKDIKNTENSYLYVDLGLLNEELNKTSYINNFILENKWIDVGIAAMPLYNIQEPYPFYTKTVDTGEIVAVSKCIRATYSFDNSKITVAIIQDKTAENGGFITNNNVTNDTRVIIYKINKCYIVLQVDNTISINDTNAFISDIVTIINNNYEEIQEQTILIK